MDTAQQNASEIIQELSGTTQLLTDEKSYAFAIAGTVSTEDIAKLKAIAALLKDLAQDTSIKIIDIESGSIKLILEGSQQGLERLEALFKSGQLEDVLGISVEDVEFVALQNSNSDQQRLAFTIAGDVTESDIAILKAALAENSNAKVSKKNIQQPARGLDFSCQNFRGCSFKGQNLEGANFSYADIRSCDFTGANLRGANFTYAQAGLQKRWAIFLVCVSWVLSGISGFLSAYTGLLITSIFDTLSRVNQVSIWTALIGIIVIIIVIIRQGLNLAYAGSVAFAVTGAYTVAFAVAGAYAGSVAYAGAVAFAFAFALTFAFAFAFAGAYAYAGARAVAFAVALILAIVLALAGAKAVAFAVAGILFSAYITGRAMKGDEKYAIIRNIAVAFAAFNGTSFRNANLTDANFTSATLKGTDFREAILTRTCFYKTKKLDRVRPGKTYLQKAQVVRVLVTGWGQEKNFDREDLRGINFQSANLVDASFIGADLSGANLQNANLSGARLVRAQLDGTDLTGATLTGAYIEDWSITTDTKFDGVRCEYVYMRLPTKENFDPFRKPDNRQEVFADGEFGDFIKPIFDTLDLYHAQSVEPRAIATAFKELAENNPNAELEIVAIERRGEDKFLLRAKTAPEADKLQLGAEYFEIYNELRGLAEQELKALIAAKDNRIRSLENFVTQALQRPSYYSDVGQVATMTNNQGSFKVGGEIRNVQGDNNKVVTGRNINTSGGNYNERIQIQGNYYTAAQQQNLAQAAAEIQVLLKQLEQTYPTTTTSEQMIVAAEAIKHIESNPSLKKRAINAAKEGGLPALEKAIDNPAGAFIVGAIKGWQEAED
ncbi:pentapeptide repeat-containing protein [Nostoc linckia FACHB-104]|nr:pentapeptide repeat-containing protein [Nostoc linckia FACHB-104]